MPAGHHLTEPPGEVHGNQFEQAGADVLTIQPDPDRLELLEPFADVSARSTTCGIRPWHRWPTGPPESCGQPDQISAFAVEGLVLEMLVLAARRRGSAGFGGERRPPSWLAEARNLLHDRSREQLQIADLANAVGVHPAHLARTFRLHFGTPVGSYARRLRLTWAAGRLREFR